MPFYHISIHYISIVVFNTKRALLHFVILVISFHYLQSLSFLLFEYHLIFPSNFIYIHASAWVQYAKFLTHIFTCNPMVRIYLFDYSACIHLGGNQKLIQSHAPVRAHINSFHFVTIVCCSAHKKKYQKVPKNKHWEAMLWICSVISGA